MEESFSLLVHGFMIFNATCWHKPSSRHENMTHKNYNSGPRLNNESGLKCQIHYKLRNMAGDRAGEMYASTNFISASKH